MKLSTKLEKLSGSASRGPWMVRTSPRDRDMFFVQAPRNLSSEPYDIEVLGEDTGNGLYPVEQRRADADLIVALVNAWRDGRLVAREDAL